MVSFCSSRINLIGNLIRKYKERVNWMMLSESWALFGGNIAPKGANSSSPGCEQILGISMDCGAPKLSPINRIFSLSIYFSLCFSCVSYEKYWHSAQGRYTHNKCKVIATNLWWLAGSLEDFSSIICLISNSSRERWPFLTQELHCGHCLCFYLTVTCVLRI